MNGPVAVVGANGFLGGAVCAAVRAAGVPHAAFTRARPGVGADGAPAPGLLEARTVYWLAGLTVPGTADRDPDFAATELEPFRRCLEALVRAGHAPTVVLSSSGGRVYDPAGEPPFAETDPVNPRDVYGEVKLALERELLGARGHVHPRVVRVANAYGPRQRSRGGHGVVAYWLDAAARGEPLTVFGDPAASRDYVFVDDVVAALLAAGASDGAPEVVNVGSGRPTSLGDLARLVRDTVGGVEVRHAPGRGFDLERTWLDVGLAREALGWSATVPLEEGLRRTWRHRGVEG